MIEQIFLPEKIGNRYLFSKKIVGIEIRKSEILASKMTVQGTSITLDLCLQESLNHESGNSQQERVQAALKALALQLGKYDIVRSCLPNSLVVFKELQLPFIDPDKIKMALPFEVEGLLPFPLSDAAIDFIVTHTDHEQQMATVLAAAIPKKHLAEHLALFAGSGIEPTMVTVDFFALYHLYQAIPTYAELQNGVVLLSLDTSTTRIGYIYNGALKLIRTINHGVSQIAKTISTHSEQPASEIIEQLVRFGISKNSKNLPREGVEDALAIWWRGIELTLTSFAAQSSEEQKISKLLLLGKGAQIDGVAKFITSQFGQQCEPFDTTLLKQANITFRDTKNGLPENNIISAGASLPSPLSPPFNLLSEEFAATDETLFLKQIITASTLCLLLIGSLCAHFFFQRYQLSRELAESQQESLAQLQERFTEIEADEDIDLDSAISTAKAELRRGHDMWFRFAPEQRPAQYLIALTNLIDRQQLGFVADKISFQEGIITLEGQVQDYDALAQLEKVLRDSPEFKPLNSPSEPRFAMRIEVPAMHGRGM